MRTAKVFSQKVNAWQLIADALSTELAVKPYLVPLAEELATVLEEARLLQANQESLRGQFMETIRLRQRLEVRGDEIRSRLSSFLRGDLGPKNLQLVRYGIPPLSGSRRQPQPEEPPPPPQPEAPAPADQAGGAAE